MPYGRSFGRRRRGRQGRRPRASRSDEADRHRADGGRVFRSAIRPRAGSCAATRWPGSGCPSSTITRPGKKPSSSARATRPSSSSATGRSTATWPAPSIRWATSTKPRSAQLGRLPRRSRSDPVEAPTAGLWAGQTDEGEIGLTYAEIDEILYHLVDEREPRTTRSSPGGFPKERVERIMALDQGRRSSSARCRRSPRSRRARSATISSIPTTGTDNALSGSSYIVATPIGNLEDITFRAVRVLKEAGHRLRRHAPGAQAPQPLRDQERADQLLPARERQRLAHSHDIAQARAKRRPGLGLGNARRSRTPDSASSGKRSREGIRVVPVPGPSAVAAALCASGLPRTGSCSWVFRLRKKKPPGKKSRGLRDEEGTLIFYLPARNAAEFCGLVRDDTGEPEGRHRPGNDENPRRIHPRERVDEYDLGIAVRNREY